MPQNSALLTGSLLKAPVTPSAVTGIIRGLASTIPVQGTMLLAIAKPAVDEVLVTIVPARAEKETDSAIPLVVRGTAEEIDLQLVEALGHYVPARTIAVRTAEQIARDTVTAAKSAAEAAKARTTASATKTKAPSLTITLEPTDAVLRVVNGTDALVDVKPGVRTTLSKGRYIATVSNELTQRLPDRSIRTKVSVGLVTRRIAAAPQFTLGEATNIVHFDFDVSATRNLKLDRMLAT